LYNHIKIGKLDRTDGSSITEGSWFGFFSRFPIFFLQESAKVV